MAAVATHLADTSALARLRHPEVAAVLAPLIDAGVVANCGVIEFELENTSPCCTTTAITTSSPSHQPAGPVGRAPRDRAVTVALA